MDCYAIKPLADGSFVFEKNGAPVVTLDAIQAHQFAAGLLEEDILLHMLALKGVALDAGRALCHFLHTLLAGDPLGVAQAFAGLSRTVTRFCGLRLYRDPDPGPMPSREWMVESTDSAAQILARFPTEAAEADRQPDEARGFGQTLRVIFTLRDVYDGGYELCQRNLGPVAREASKLIHDLDRAVSPFLYKLPDLASLARPLQHFVHDAAEQAVRTRKLLRRAEARITREVTEKVTAGAREAGRGEVLGRILDQVKALLGSGK
jgi:hypothetical protein